MKAALNTAEGMFEVAMPLDGINQAFACAQDKQNTGAVFLAITISQD